VFDTLGGLPVVVPDRPTPPPLIREFRRSRSGQLGAASVRTGFNETGFKVRMNPHRCSSPGFGGTRLPDPAV